MLMGIRIEGNLGKKIIDKYSKKGERRLEVLAMLCLLTWQLGGKELACPFYENSLSFTQDLWNFLYVNIIYSKKLNKTVREFLVNIFSNGKCSLR